MSRLLAMLTSLLRGRASAAGAKKKTRRHRFLVINTVLVSFASGPVLAHPWQDYYGPGGASGIGSYTMTAIIAVSGSECQVCHSGSEGGPPWNSYGWAVRQQVQSGSTLLAAMISVEQLDSDGNGTVNLLEIMGDAQPGWTNGTNFCFGLDGIASPCDPPTGVLLDPFDSDNDGIGDAMDDNPSAANNFCFGVAEYSFSETVASDLTCAAPTSITVVPLAEVMAEGNLRLIAPVVTFESGFVVAGQLTVISADPCPGCSP